MSDPRPPREIVERNWPDRPCNSEGCGRTDENHPYVVIYWNEAGNISVRVDRHIWPMARGGWGGTHGRGWSTVGSDRAAYRRARDRARSLAATYECGVRDGVRRRFLADAA